MENNIQEKNAWAIIKKYAKRYLVDAMGGMAYGLLASLIILVVVQQFGKIPGLEILSSLGVVTLKISGAAYSYDLFSAASPLIGSAVGVGVALALKVRNTVIYPSVLIGAVGYMLGGPVGSYITSIIGVEVGNKIAGHTKIDIMLVPFVVIITGSLAAFAIGPYVAQLMTFIGNIINISTELRPIPMGMIISVILCIALFSPISSAGLCISLGLSGLAAGAATTGCCVSMIGFAVASFRENKWGGLISQGIGTSKIQLPNIMRHPVICLPVVITAFILGPLSTTIFGMTNNSIGAGMGTSSFVGQINTFIVMVGAGEPFASVLVKVLILNFILPAIITLGISEYMRKKGWIKHGYMELELQ